MKPYERYKDSGVEWLGEVPEHWGLIRMNYAMRPIDERSDTGTETLLSVSEHHGVRPRSEVNVNMFMAESYKGYKLCKKGDLVINSLWAWSRGLGVSEYEGIVSTAYSVFRLKKTEYDKRYLNYLLRIKNMSTNISYSLKGYGFHDCNCLTGLS